MIQYPEKLNLIFRKLELYNIKPIIVGGYIRDSLLQIESKDIDIELYNICSYESLEKILQEFGSVNSVGKSFGVCKLDFEGLDLDFSLPRIDSKIANGHTGFKVQTYSNMNFTTASRRRDFTINSIGYDVLNKKLLDPNNGIQDLKDKILHPVDKNTFIEDPLRVLRAVQFSARFEFVLSQELFTLCSDMLKNSCLNELPRERIFTEIEKLLLKSSKISIGLELLKELGALEYFSELKSLNTQEWEDTLFALDKMAKQKSINNKKNIILMLTILSFKLEKNLAISFIIKLSEEKDLIKNILALRESKIEKNMTNYQLYSLAQRVNLNDIITLYSFLDAVHLQEYIELKQRAKKLNILNNKLTPILQGRDLISSGLQASPDFSTYLDKAYEAQKNELFKNHKDALKWLKIELLR